ncbi:MAG: ankyrin repeat domain-containing protein [Gammaproteobacteria bacterium]|nr:ankyrin repeat domain-containing protein [Gammaproteobacteria bacterium]
MKVIPLIERLAVSLNLFSPESELSACRGFACKLLESYFLREQSGRGGHDLFQRRIQEMIRLDHDSVQTDKFEATITALKTKDASQVTEEQHKLILLNMEMCMFLGGMLMYQTPSRYFRPAKSQCDISEISKKAAAPKFIEYFEELKCIYLEIGIYTKTQLLERLKLFEFTFDQLHIPCKNSFALLLSSRSHSSVLIYCFDQLWQPIDSNDDIDPNDITLGAHILSAEETVDAIFYSHSSLEREVIELIKALAHEEEKYLQQKANPEKNQNHYSIELMYGHNSFNLIYFDGHWTFSTEEIIQSLASVSSLQVSLKSKREIAEEIVNSTHTNKVSPYISIATEIITTPWMEKTFDLTRPIDTLQWQQPVTETLLISSEIKYFAQISTSFNHVHNIQLLLDLSVDLTQIDCMDQTDVSLLHLAAQNCCVEVIRLFLTQFHDINLKNKEGDTPLHVAVNFGQLPIVLILLSSGASTNVLNHKNQRPINIAQQHNYQDITEALESSVISHPVETQETLNARARLSHFQPASEVEAEQKVSGEIQKNDTAASINSSLS